MLNKKAKNCTTVSQNIQQSLLSKNGAKILKRSGELNNLPNSSIITKEWSVLSLNITRKSSISSAKALFASLGTS